jgi:S1-C subfamily serine protease
VKLRLGSVLGLALVGLLLVLKWTGALPNRQQAQQKSAANNQPVTASSVPVAATEIPEIPRPESKVAPNQLPQLLRVPGAPDSRQLVRIQPTDEIVGIGAALKMNSGELIIMSLVQGGPAEKAGLPSGWIVDKVDGASMRDLPLAECVQMIRGPIGTKVKLELLEPETNERRVFEVARETIVVK